MTHKRRLVCTAISALLTAAPLQGAFATCVNALQSGAIWHMHVIEVSQSGEPPHAIRCVLRFGANGAFTAPCTKYDAGSTTPQTVNVSGKITLKATCDFVGAVNIPSDTKVFIKFGHINDNVGSGLAIQGTGADTQVLHLTFIRK